MQLTANKKQTTQILTGVEMEFRFNSKYFGVFIVIGKFYCIDTDQLLKSVLRIRFGYFPNAWVFSTNHTRKWRKLEA